MPPRQRYVMQIAPASQPSIPLRASIYVSGKLVHNVYAYRDETVEELRERVNKSILVAVLEPDLTLP